MICVSRKNRFNALLLILCGAYWVFPQQVQLWSQDSDAAAKIITPPWVKIRHGESDSDIIRIYARNQPLNNLRLEVTAFPEKPGKNDDALSLELSPSEIPSIPSQQSRNVDLLIRSSGTGLSFAEYDIHVTIQTDENLLQDNFPLTVAPSRRLLFGLYAALVGLLIAVFLIIFLRMKNL